MAVETRLWLVRHGATEWTATGRLCGWADVPLSEMGRAQASRLRPALSDEAFSGVWASDLARALETARIARGEAKADPRLRELDFGSIEGSTWGELDEPTRGALLEFDHFAAKGGESVQGLCRRVFEFADGLAGGNHLVFTHGGVIRALTRHLGSEAKLDPGGLVVVEWGEGGSGAATDQNGPGHSRTRSEM